MPNLNRIDLEMGEILHKTFLENWTETDTHTHTHTDPRTTRNPVSQHYRVGLENILFNIFNFGSTYAIPALQFPITN